MHQVLGILAICGLWMFGFDLIERALDVFDALTPPKHFILQRLEYFNSKEKTSCHSSQLQKKWDSLKARSLGLRAPEKRLLKPYSPSTSRRPFTTPRRSRGLAQK